MSGKTFPNNWQHIHDADDDEFGTCTFEEFMESAYMWSVPSSHACIMRVENTNTGKIKEYAYKRVHSATDKLTKLVDDPNNVITICDDESIHHLVHPQNEHYFPR